MKNLCLLIFFQTIWQLLLETSKYKSNVHMLEAEKQKRLWTMSRYILGIVGNMSLEQ